MFGLNTKLIVGYDLGNSYSQISYCIPGRDEDRVETLSQVAGAEVFSIPTVLCKRQGANQWYYGKDAIRYGRENNIKPVDNLLKRAIAGERVMVEGEEYDSVALLTLFFKRSLSMLFAELGTDKMEHLTLTIEQIGETEMDLLDHLVDGARIKAEKITYKTHVECFYSYILRQEPKFLGQKILLLEYGKNEMISYSMDCNQRTSPKVVYVKQTKEPFREYYEEEELKIDDAFADYAAKIMEQEKPAVVYLIGEYFKEEWMKKSLPIICKGSRVFKGNNLYSKGACFDVLESLKASDYSAYYIFLGEDKLKSNVGMRVLDRGNEIYIAVLNAGNNWFEVRKNMELYVKDQDYLDLVITPLIAGDPRVERISLPGISPGISRIHIQASMVTVDKMKLFIEDLGFGEIRASEGFRWEREIEL